MQCRGRTKNGNRCRRAAAVGDYWCNQHSPEALCQHEQRERVEDQCGWLMLPNFYVETLECTRCGDTVTRLLDPKAVTEQVAQRLVGLRPMGDAA